MLLIAFSSSIFLLVNSENINCFISLKSISLYSSSSITLFRTLSLSSFSSLSSFITLYSSSFSLFCFLSLSSLSSFISLFLSSLFNNIFIISMKIKGFIYLFILYNSLILLIINSNFLSFSNFLPFDFLVFSLI